MLRALLIVLALVVVAPAQGVRAVGQSGARQMTRVLFFKSSPKFHIPVQYAITYGVPGWKKSYSAMLKGDKAQRFRFGKDWWTTFDTNVDLTIGGAKLAAGAYYCVLERSAKGGMALVCLPAADVRKQKLDPFQSPETKGGVVIPLMHTEQEESTKNLSIKLTPNPEDANKGKLSIDWGPNRLTAQIKVHYEG